MKRKFCLPCFLELKKAGKHDIQRVGGGVNMKVTCWRCKRRRYSRNERAQVDETWEVTVYHIRHHRSARRGRRAARNARRVL